MSNINSIFVKSNDDIENDNIFSDIFKIIDNNPKFENKVKQNIKNYSDNRNQTDNQTEKYNIMTENLNFNYDDVDALRLYLGQTLYKLDERDNEIINYKKQIKVLTRILEEQKVKIINLENQLKNTKEIDNIQEFDKTKVIDKKEFFKNYS